MFKLKKKLDDIRNGAKKIFIIGILLSKIKLKNGNRNT